MRWILWKCEPASAAICSRSISRKARLSKKETCCAVIDPRPFEAELNRAKAQLEEAKANLTQSTAKWPRPRRRRSKAEAGLDLHSTPTRTVEDSCVPTNAITQEEFDQQKSELLQAEAEVEGAGARSKSSQGRDRDGERRGGDRRSGRRDRGIESGVHACSCSDHRPRQPPRRHRRQPDQRRDSQSTLLTTIVSLDPIHCYFDADEQAFLKYMRLAMEGKRQSSRDVKNPVYVALADEKNGFPPQGHMDFVDNRLDPNTGTMRGRAIFRNPDHR